MSKKKDYRITCSEDGTLTITCNMYRIAHLRRELTEMHNKAIVNTAKTQWADNPRLNVSAIAREFDISPSSVLKVLKAHGYKRSASFD